MKLAAPFLTRLLRVTARAIEATLPRVRTTADEEAIHDMRVAVRRMRVLLKIARPIWIRPQIEAIRAGFTLVHRATSELRDEEVLRETLADAPLTTPTFVRFRNTRAKREADLRGQARARLRGGALRRPREKLNALLMLPGARPVSLEHFALKVHHRLHDRVKKQRHAAVDDGVALHELRIAFKNLRYASELLEPALPPERAATAKPAAKFQKHLGEVHDLDVATEIVKRARALTHDDRAMLVTWLAARRDKRIRSYLEDRESLVLIEPVKVPIPVASSLTPSPSPSPSPSRAPSRSRARSPKA
ncbi:hypothetical protein BH09MYX1_BH09MYX1_22550 [soil metagenome]